MAALLPKPPDSAGKPATAGRAASAGKPAKTAGTRRGNEEQSRWSAESVQERKQHDGDAGVDDGSDQNGNCNVFIAVLREQKAAGQREDRVVKQIEAGGQQETREGMFDVDTRADRGAHESHCRFRD